ncbi:hypothetical protein NHJ13734_002735 [Beauveria thailandica]
MNPNPDSSDGENSDGFVVTGAPDKDTSDNTPLTAEKLTEVRKWLEPTAYDILGGEYQKHASLYLFGTGNWLTASPEYQQWLTSRDYGLLWIKGIPGSGKSVMAAKIIAELSASEPKCPVLYFFFRQIIDANHKPAALLRDWMDQLLVHSPVLQRQLYSYTQEGRSLKSVSPDDMWKDLKMAFASLSERVYCITDALDEMDQGNDSFLKALANLGLWMPAKVKVLITSRPVASVETSLRSIPCLKIRLQEDEVDKDISRFVKHSLGTSQLDKRHWPAIINAVPGTAKGLFLYSRLAMDTFLEHGVDVQNALAHLPTDLHVLYTNLLREHIVRSGIDDQIQRFILQAVTHATRPLRLLEIAEMISVVDVDRDLKTRKELVKAACGPLLEILADETVSVIHHSFTEYLKGITRAKGDPGYPALDSGAAHEQLALTCLRYLQSGSLSSFPPSLLDHKSRQRLSDTKIALWQEYPFLKYATGNWFKHVILACSASPDDTKLLPEIRQFLENDHFRSSWCRLQFKRMACDVSKVHIAAKSGLTGYLKELIHRGADVDCLDHQGKTPLWWAASDGHADTVQALIAAGVKLDREDNASGNTPLHQAAQKNHFSVVELLLQAGVSPTIRKGLGASHHYSCHCVPSYGESPLRYACERGHWETLNVMLKYVTDLDDVHWALAWAACGGQSRLVSRILEHPGVDVNAINHGDTFLYLACSSLDMDTINILLHASADTAALSIGDRHPLSVDIDYTPKPTGSPTQSCLSAMVQNHKLWQIVKNPIICSEVEKLFGDLFAAGLDVNQRDDMNRTLLHRVTQSATLTNILISAGADARATDKHKCTPLHFCTNPEVISILVKRGGADMNAVNKDGRTPLHQSVNSQAATSKLLEYGSDPNILDNEGNSPLHLLLARTSPDTSLEHVTLLLRFGADPSLKNHCGLTPFRSISNLYTGRKIADCLIQAGADIDATDNDGRTVLFDVVGRQHQINQERVWTLEYLVGARASKESRDHQGRKISHEAIKGLMSSHDLGLIVQWLDALDSLELLDLEAVDNAGNNPLHELCYRVQNTRNRHAIDMHLVRLLTGAGLDMSQKNHAGQTPLHLLCTRPCEAGSSRFVFDQPIVYAIHHCENVDERDSNGNTALHIASVYEESWCKLLLDGGADPTVRNHEGLTPLHLAARCKQSNTIGLLLMAIHDRLGDTPSEEADCINATVVKNCHNIHEPYNITALFYACQSGRPESVKLLLDAGADPNIGSLFVACAMMEHENRLWTSKDQVPGSAIAALRTLDTTRPRSMLEHQSDLSHPFASTRLEEILEMLVSSGISLPLLHSDPTRGYMNPFWKASALNSDYAFKCLSAIKRKHWATIGNVPEQAMGRDALSLFDEKMMALSDSISHNVMQQSGWLQPGGVDFNIFHAIIVRRQYHLIKQMVKAGCRFLLPGIPHLEYLIVHGFTSLFDYIVKAEVQVRLAEGEWHAYGDATKPGLHFQPNSDQDGSVRSGQLGEELRNKMLEYAVRRELPNMDIVRLLVDNYAVNINGGDRNRNTALHIIARGNHWWQSAQALPFLLKSGANIESENSSGQTPLHLTLDKEYFQLGKLGSFHKDVAETLIDAGANVNAIDFEGRSCLDCAGYSTDLIDLLISNGAVIRSDSIFAALKADNSAALEILLQGEADANGRMLFSGNVPDRDNTDDSWGDSRMTFDAALIPRHEVAPIYYIASKSGFPEDPDMRSCFRKLLNYGANIYARFQVQRGGHKCGPTYGGDYNKLIGVAEELEGAVEERSVLHELVRLGKLSKCMIDAMDIDAGCLDPKGCNLLHAVCDSWGGPDHAIDMTLDNVDDDDDGDDEKEEERISAFQQLLALGCDIQARDSSGQSVVHHMIYRGWKHTRRLARLEMSIEEVSRIAPDILSAPNASGNTPLHYSVLLATSTRRTEQAGEKQRKDQMVDLTRLLLRSGASPTGINRDGNSVLHFMAHNLDRGDVAVLFAELVRGEHGLDVNARNARGETPLMLLANRANVLLRLGAGCGSLCLDDEAAAQSVAMLAELGADFAVTDAQGNGLLHLAATDEVQLFKAFMDSGKLDPMLENLAHQTAIDVAATYDNNEILALFQNSIDESHQ